MTTTRELRHFLKNGLPVSGVLDGVFPSRGEFVIYIV